MLKVDVEDMELPLLNALSRSGDLCSPKLTDVFVELGLLAMAAAIVHGTRCRGPLPRVLAHPLASACRKRAADARKSYKGGQFPRKWWAA